MIPVASYLAAAGSNPCSSASVPKVRAPPDFGVAVETPLFLEEPWFEPPPPLELGLDEHAASNPPAPPAAAAVAAPLARNDRRSNRLGTVPPWSVSGGRPLDRPADLVDDGRGPTLRPPRAPTPTCARAAS